MSYEKYVIANLKEGNEMVEYHGIPFSVTRRGELIQPLGYGNSVEINEKCSVLFFLGLTTEKPEGSEWWGQSERYYYQGTRLFIGDRLGRIDIIYSDDTMELIPVIFGVNVWPYELYTKTREYEKDMNTYHGPYCEPFASDKNAKNLLDNSLILMENDAEKTMKYILAVKVKDKTVSKAVYHKEAYREAGLVVSAVTGLKADTAVNTRWKIIHPDYFLKREYFTPMDKLARRLYQFRDEIPASVAPETPADYDGPIVRFTGNSAADIFTNVYLHNLDDMAKNKVDEDGLAHTSSAWAPNFGIYVGFGTYREDFLSYSKHMWARDVGRILLELVEAGESKRTEKAGDMVHRYLYDPCIKYKRPHWKRIINSWELEDLRKFVAGKENDGHAAIMMFIFSLYQHGVVDRSWLCRNMKQLHDAVDWIGWQIENPLESNFDRVLYSESEASTQIFGGYDLFSNIYVYYALKGYEKIAQFICDSNLEEKSFKYAQTLKSGILDVFTTIHPRYGRTFIDTLDDCWTWEYKRFAPLFLLPDIYTYEAERFDTDISQICRNTYLAQKEDYFSYAAGRQMGYGQGYLTQACMLLDEYEDFTGCIEQAAFFCYHHSDYNYTVPEGVIMHPSGRFWFRNADLGNAVQQGEIVKCGRLIIGLDDLTPEYGLKIIPRLPAGWQKIEVENYSIAADTGSRVTCKVVEYIYERLEDGYRMRLKFDCKVRMGYIRIGPFKPEVKQVDINDKNVSYSMRMVGNHRFAYIDFSCSDKSELELVVRAM